MTEMVAVGGLAVIAAFLAVVLKPQRPELALALTLLAGIGVTAAVLARVVPVLQTAQSLLDQAALSGETGKLLFKSLGICLLTQLTADVCRDAGENGLAAKTELAGKVTMLALALPLFEQVGALALQFIRGDAS